MIGKLLNVSSSPHVRSKLTVGGIMYDVIISLLPATFFGIYHFGLHAFLVIATSIASCCITEFVFDYICHKPNTLKDGSAIVTGLLLGLCLSPTVPLYIPYLGGVFAILFAKCLLGGLGENFINPALAARCFLLISFGTVMTNFGVDGISSATPLAVLANGGEVNVLEMFLGFTNGTIGVSVAAMLLGGIYLLVCGIITWHIPVAYIASFLVIMGFGGGHGFDPMYLAAQFCGGGLVLGALFMATDPVTSPITTAGHIMYGVMIGVLTAVFRLYGNATESVSYAIILGNLVTPLIDKFVISKPFGVGGPKKQGFAIPKAAIILTVVAILAGAALGGVNYLTKDTIEAQVLAANAEAYRSALPTADSFKLSNSAENYIEEYGKDVYGSGDFGRVYINQAVVGYDASGNLVGYAVRVTTADGFEGNIVLTVGIQAEGTISGISFTELNETAGMGMRVDEESWKAQFIGVNTDSFVLIKSGSASAANEIDSVSGASTTSGAVVKAVNAAIDFVGKHVK